MSQENVEIVRAVFEAWNAGDRDALRDAYDPEMSSWCDRRLAGARPFSVGEAVLRAFEQLRDTWRLRLNWTTSGLIEAGDRVAVRTVWHGIGHGPESKHEST